MSRLFGPMRQIGYVVPDIEVALHHWVETCGVGPWFVTDKLPLTKFVYNGQRRDDIHVTIGLANSGDVQIELIQQRCTTPSMYREFLAEHPSGGLQHWSSWPENYDELYARATAQGYTVGQEGDAPRGRFVYFRQTGHPGTIIEMSHATPTRKRIFESVRNAALGWDGSDPIRRAWPT
jgi:hypothetical protein